MAVLVTRGEGGVGGGGCVERCVWKQEDLERSWGHLLYNARKNTKQKDDQ